MKTSLEWLNAHLDRPATADEVERLLTEQGTPIETREPRPGDDVMLDVEVTSNRSDCLSHVGVAREVAAGSGRALKLPEFDCGTGSGEGVESLTSVKVDRSDLCPVYTARVIRGVKVGPSPAWLSRRLEAIGLRSVSNVVDVTNYVLFELGQPLHAFDLAKLSGRRVVVRTAREGESFDAIDGTKHRLRGDMLVIADDTRPAAIAGVMGGLLSEVGFATRDILIESAVFDPLSVRRTSRALRLSSDSSYRFERGVDPLGVERASRRAARLILELAGGTLAPRVIRVGAAEPAPRRITLRLARCEAITGLGLAPERVVELLARLGLSPKLDAAAGTVACVAPTFRLDLEREVDLIEEVARLHGLNHVPVCERIEINARPIQPVVAARRRLNQSLVAHGYHEAVTFSFVKPAQVEAFLDADRSPLLIDDERRKTEPMLRPSVIPSLLVCRKSNQDVGNTGVRLFESASTWARRGGEAGEIVEARRLGMIADVGAGGAGESLRDLRTAIEEAIAAIAGDAGVTFVATTKPWMAAGAEIRLGDKAVGVMGQLAPAALKLFDLGVSVVAAELDVEALLALFPPQRTVRALSRFPAIERDLSLVVEETVTWDAIRSQVLSASPALMEELRFLVTYRGKPIPAGRKSVSLRMTFRDPSATLRHEQVDGQVTSVVERLKSSLGAELRS